LFSHNSRAWFKLVFISTVLSLASNFQYGFSTTYLNTPVDSFKAYLRSCMLARHVSTSATNWMWYLLINIWFVGFFFGIWLSPLLNDRLGRKVGFIIANVFSLAASLFRYLAIVLKVPELLFIGRVIASVVSATAYQALILYLQECSPTDLRGMLSFMSEITYSGMCAVGMLLGTSQIFGRRLSYLTGFAVIPSMLSILALLPIPDTPKFLYITKNNQEAAIKSLKFFRGDDVDIDSALDGFKKEQEEDSKNTTSFKEILTTPYIRKAIVLSCFALQNTVPLWSIMLSSTQFLRDVNLNSGIAEWSSTVMTLLYILGTIIGFFIVERFRRRLLCIGLSSLNNASLLLFVIFEQLNKVVHSTKYLCIVCLLLYGLNFRMGVGPLSWILSSELVPQRHRSLVQSFCYSVNTIMVVISTFAVLPLYDVINSYAFLILYIVPSTISIIYLYRNLPETSNREVFDVVEDLKNSKNKPEKE
uniref:MFS domain-containing protein n=1 Tax=Syphacia muris TaxID=451379 RepID=A0A0N5AFZ1_9BILA